MAQIPLLQTRRGRAPHENQTRPVIPDGSTLKEQIAKMNPRIDEAENLLTPSEVAALFRVDPKTGERSEVGKLERISSVSGGSIASAAFALAFPALEGLSGQAFYLALPGRVYEREIGRRRLAQSRRCRRKA